MLLYSNAKVLILTPEDFTVEGKVKKQALEDYKNADVVISIGNYKETTLLKNRWGNIGRVVGRV